MAFILRWVSLPNLGSVRVAEIPAGEYGGSIIIDLFSYLYNTGANINFLIHRLSWIATLACFKWRNYQIDRSHENILSRPVTERTRILSIYTNWVCPTTTNKSKESYWHVCQAIFTQGNSSLLSTIPLKWKLSIIEDHFYWHLSILHYRFLHMELVCGFLQFLLRLKRTPKHPFVNLLWPNQPQMTLCVVHTTLEIENSI